MVRSPARVILHFDLDAFYAQVEHERLGIPRDIPLGVQQWSSLIAVNYSARPFGVKRGMLVEDARKACKNFQSVHVELINEKGPFSLPVNATLSTAIHQSSKASLSRYRTASIKVMNAAKRACSALEGAVFERASIDEFYLDCTKVADGAFLSSCNTDAMNIKVAGIRLADALEKSQIAGVSGEVQFPKTEDDLRLVAGAAVALHLRSAIFDSLNYTVSAGIAHSRLTSKVASAQNKPMKQTIVPSSGAASAFAMLPLRKLPQLGGKLGESINSFLRQRFDCGNNERQFTAGELATVPLRDLKAYFGERTGIWLHNRCRGLDRDKVTARPAVKSIQAFKSGPSSMGDATGLSKWIKILSLEIALRIMEDTSENKRKPEVLMIYYTPAERGGSRGKMRSLREPYPPQPFRRNRSKM